MDNKEIEELFKNAKPLIAPDFTNVIKKTCHNCQDSIVCFGMDEPPNDNRAENCPSWHLDFMEYQNLIEKYYK